MNLAHDSRVLLRGAGLRVGRRALNFAHDSRVERNLQNRSGLRLAGEFRVRYLV